MKVPLAAILVLGLILGAAAQQRAVSPGPGAGSSPSAAADLRGILADLQRVSVSTNGDLGRLRIEKWKADGSERQQMQQVADSLQKNITNAIPGLIGDVQAQPGSVAKAFKLSHNLNVVYEFLNSLAEAAGAFGKKEEYEPLAGDATSLDAVRQKLSTYIEQVAANLENQPKPAATSQNAAANPGPKKIVVDNGPAPKTKKKKTTAPPPQYPLGILPQPGFGLAAAMPCSVP